MGGSPGWSRRSTHYIGNTCVRAVYASRRRARVVCTQVFACAHRGIHGTCDHHPVVPPGEITHGGPVATQISQVQERVMSTGPRGHTPPPGRLNGLAIERVSLTRSITNPFNRPGGGVCPRGPVAMTRSWTWEFWVATGPPWVVSPGGTTGRCSQVPLFPDASAPANTSVRAAGDERASTAHMCSLCSGYSAWTTRVSHP